MSIAVAALILGKSVLLADMLPAINRYPDRPLVYNIGWKTAIYLLMALLIHYLERLFDFSKTGRRDRRRQRKAVRGNRVAAFLGHPDTAVRADPDVLHDARTGALHRQGPGVADILRAEAGRLIQPGFVTPSQPIAASSSQRHQSTQVACRIEVRTAASSAAVPWPAQIRGQAA